jgi:hypothetical protein
MKRRIESQPEIPGDFSRSPLGVEPEEQLSTFKTLLPSESVFSKKKISRRHFLYISGGAFLAACVPESVQKVTEAARNLLTEQTIADQVGKWVGIPISDTDGTDYSVKSGANLDITRIKNNLMILSPSNVNNQQDTSIQLCFASTVCENSKKTQKLANFIIVKINNTVDCYLTEPTDVPETMSTPAAVITPTVVYNRQTPNITPEVNYAFALLKLTADKKIVTTNARVSIYKKDTSPNVGSIKIDNQEYLLDAFTFQSSLPTEVPQKIGLSLGGNVESISYKVRKSTPQPTTAEQKPSQTATQTVTSTATATEVVVTATPTPDAWKAKLEEFIKTNDQFRLTQKSNSEFSLDAVQQIPDQPLTLPDPDVLPKPAKSWLPALELTQTGVKVSVLDVYTQNAQATDLTLPLGKSTLTWDSDRNTFLLADQNSGKQYAFNQYEGIDGMHGIWVDNSPHGGVTTKPEYWNAAANWFSYPEFQNRGMNYAAEVLAKLRPVEEQVLKEYYQKNGELENISHNNKFEYYVWSPLPTADVTESGPVLSVSRMQAMGTDCYIIGLPFKFQSNTHIIHVLVEPVGMREWYKKMVEYYKGSQGSKIRDDYNKSYEFTGQVRSLIENKGILQSGSYSIFGWANPKIPSESGGPENRLALAEEEKFKALFGFMPILNDALPHGPHFIFGELFYVKDNNKAELFSWLEQGIWPTSRFIFGYY